MLSRHALMLPICLTALGSTHAARSAAGIQADGSFYWTGNANVLTAPEEADIVITHVTLSVTAERLRCFAQFPVTLSTEGKTLWEFEAGTPTVHRYRWRDRQTDTKDAKGLTGLRVPAGATLHIAANTGDLDYDCQDLPPNHLRVNYTVDGYYASR